jgi:hypothetical protein
MGTVTDSDTERLVEEWKIKQLVSLGFSDDEVATMLVNGIDHHDAALLLKGGCAHSTVIRILHP